MNSVTFYNYWKNLALKQQESRVFGTEDGENEMIVSLSKMAYKLCKGDVNCQNYWRERDLNPFLFKILERAVRA